MPEIVLNGEILMDTFCDNTSYEVTSLILAKVTRNTKKIDRYNGSKTLSF